MSQPTLSEISELLFKKYSGVVDTSSTKSVGQEPPVLAYPKIIPSAQIYAQPIPALAPSDLSNNFFITSISGIGGPLNPTTNLSGYCTNRQYSNSNPHIVKYTDLRLTHVGNDSTGFSYCFAGTNMSTPALTASTNLLSKVIPYSYDPAGSYQYKVSIWDSGSNGYNSYPGSSDATHPWVLDTDAGYIRFFGDASPDPSGSLIADGKPPLITFWRYEGTMGLGGGDTGPVGPAGPLAGTDTQIIYNNGGIAAGSPNLTFNGSKLTTNAISSGSLALTTIANKYNDHILTYDAGTGVVSYSSVPTPNDSSSEITILVGTNTTNTTIYYTYNGKTWNEKRITTPSGVQTLSSTLIATNATLILIGCSGEGIAYSSNGLEWNYSTSAKTLFSSNKCNALIWGSYQWVAVANTFFATSKDGILWTRSPKPRFFQNPTADITLCKWVTTAYNGYMWVSLGSYNNTQGLGAYSLDGVQWTAYTITDISNCSVMACNSSIWLSACTIQTQNKMYSSIDGLNWSPITNTWFNCQTICSNGSIWLAGGSQGIYISDISGYNWQSIQPGVPLTIGNTTVTPASVGTINMTSNTIISISWNGAIWIAASSTILYYSNNGYDWYESTLPTKINANQGLTTYKYLTTKNTQLEDIKTACPVKSVTENFSVIVGTNHMAYSYDGLKWFNNLNPLADFHSVKYNSFLWVAGGETLAYSYDGIMWTQCTGAGATYAGTGTGPGTVNTINTHTGSCSASEPIYETAACVDQPTVGTTISNPTGWTDIAFNNNGWTAIGYANKITTSSDGITWSTLQSILDVHLNAIAASDTMWIAVGQAVTVYSFTADYWTINDESPINANAVAYNGSIWVIVGTPVEPNTAPYIMYSKNGIDWLSSCLPSSIEISSVVLHTIGWNGSLWISGGKCSTGAIIYYSMDAKRWYLVQDIPTAMTMVKSVTWNGENWLAIDQTSTNILTSSDGFIWTPNAKTNLTPNTKYKIATRFNTNISQSQLDCWNRPVSPIFTLPTDHVCAVKYLTERPNYRLRVRVNDVSGVSLTLPYVKPFTSWYIQNLTLMPLLPIHAPDASILTTITGETITINFFDTTSNFNVISD